MAIAIAESARRHRYSATAGQTVFAYTFPVLASTDLAVYRLRAGVVTPLNETTDYTVGGVGVEAGGSITLTAAAQLNDIIAIDGDLDTARSSNFVQNGAFSAEAINLDLNRSVIMSQERARDASRAVAISPVDDPSISIQLPLVAARANKWLAFDNTGKVIALAAPSDDGVQWRGQWSTGLIGIALDDVVKDDGVLYLAKLAHVAEASNRPGVGGSWATYWDVWVPRPFNPRGAHTVGDVYATSDVISHLGQSFFARVAHTATADTTPVSGAQWETYWQTALGAAAVLSVYGRTGAVVATLGDYPASKITNDSNVTGDTVKDALNFEKARLDALLAGASGAFDTLAELKGLVDVEKGRLDAILAGANASMDTFAEAKSIVDTQIARIDAMLAGANASMDTFAEAKSIVDTQIARIDAILASADAAMNTFAEVKTAIDAINANGWVTTARIADDAVTFAKVQNIGSAVLLGRNTAGSGNIEELISSIVTEMLDEFVASGSGHKKGLVPDPPAVAGTTLFLREDKSWAPPPGASGGETNTASNAGAGVGVFRGKVGFDLEFRSLLGAGVNIETSGSNELLLSTARQNLLINGDFVLNQRNFAFGALSTGVYGVDRWKAQGSSNLAWNSSTRTLTINSGAIRQVIEPALWGYINIASRPVVVSVDNLTGGNLTVAVGSASGTITAGSGRQSVALTLGAGDTGNINVTLTPTAYPVTFRSVKLELGNSPTEWIPRDIKDELLLAGRYCQLIAKGAAGGSSISPYYFQVLSPVIDGLVRAITPMYATPTLISPPGSPTFQGSNPTTGNTLAFYNNTGGGFAGIGGSLSLSFVGASPNNFGFRLQASSFSTTAGGIGHLYLGPSVNLLAEAEL